MIIMTGRTANSIKNRFYSSMRREQHRRQPLKTELDFSSQFFPDRFKRSMGSSSSQGGAKKRFKADGGIVATSKLPAMAAPTAAALDFRLLPPPPLLSRCNLSMMQVC